MTKKSWLLATLGTFALFASNAQAQDTLRVSTYMATSHWFVTEAMEQWSKDVASATGGRLKIAVQPTALGRPQQHFEIARDGIADLTVGIPGYTPGRFIVNSVSGVPNSGNYAESLGAAYWRTLQKFPEMQKEYEGVVPLSVFSTTPMRLFSTGREIKSLDDFKGMKVHTAGGMMSEVANSLNMVPIIQPTATAYEVLSSGVVDGIIFTSDGVASFKLERLIKRTLTVPGGLTSAQGFLAMNPAKFNALSPDIRAALVKVSGEHFARLIGRLWDQRDSRGMEALKVAGSQFMTADPTFRAEIFSATEQAIESWLKQVRERRGIDGRKILETYRQENRSLDAEIQQRVR